MKLIILLSVALLAFAADENTQQPVYHAVNEEMLTTYPNCEVYTISNGVVTGCTTCQPGYKKSGSACVLEAVTSNIAKCTEGGQCTYTQIGFDGSSGTCDGYSTSISNAQGTGSVNPTIPGHSENTCLACVEYVSGKTNVCAQCATGYLLNKDGKCTPLSINPWGEPNTITNDVCFVGEYTNGNPVCAGCSLDYQLSGSVCIGMATDVTKGCIEAVVVNSEPKCLKCRDGYTLNSEGICIGGNNDHCEKYNTENGACEKCMKGYVYIGSTCLKCSTVTSNPEPVNGDECSILSTSNCEICNPNCAYDSTLYVCVSKHCDLFDSENNCIRCEQGYQLTTENTCVACENDCFKDSTKKECVDGYYKATDASGNSVCRKCEGKCTKCLSKDVCVTDSIAVDRGTAMNGLPCFDKNCKQCNPDNRHMCYECKEGTNTKLLGGRCYVKSEYISAGSTFEHLCRYYQQPDFITNKNALVNYDDSYIRSISLAYTKGPNKISGSGEDAVYYCEYNDNLPHYYRYYDGQLTCAGANRDPSNDCECKVGYYPENVNKFSNCIEFTKFKFCAQPLNENICGKCLAGLKLVKYTDNNKQAHYECGCPTGQRPNKNGVCIPCSRKCKTCRTNFEGGVAEELCLSCNGRASVDYATAEANDFYRDKTNLCECKPGYVEKEHSEIVYGCNLIPSGCNNNAESYSAAEYLVNCKQCDEEGFSTSSHCEECSEGYFQKTNTQAPNGQFECIRCPTVDGTISYCSSCSGENQCTGCKDQNLIPDEKCQKCSEGYSLIKIVDDQGNFVRPYCLKCSNLCNVTESDGCFLAKDETDYDARKQSRTVKESEINSMSIFCDVCKDAGSEPKTGCSCGFSHYTDSEGLCKDCSAAIGEASVEFIDGANEDATKSAKLNKLCKFSNTDKTACKFNDFSSGSLDCTVCSDAYSARKPDTNCTKCIDGGSYPIEGGTEAEKGCRKCPSYCKYCTSAKKCVQCAVDGVRGELCDQCLDGYFKDESKSTAQTIVCTKCAEGCSRCTGKATNCQNCTVDHHIPNGEDGACDACETGYYFNYLDSNCVEVNKAIGAIESRPLCLNSEGSEIVCNTENLNAGKIAEVKERPTKCDTSIYGVSVEPVNGFCVCKTGYFDNRTKEEIEADPKPICTPVQLLTGDDFCIDGIQTTLTDGNYTYSCSKCNADYLTVENGKCKCKNTHYTTSWGMCVPCGRHNKGCAECSGKTVCTKCESGYTLNKVDEQTVTCKAS